MVRLFVCLPDIRVFFIVCLFMTVRRHVRRVRQVPPQRGGRGHILGADRAVGQQEQQEDAGAEDSPVRRSAYGTLKHPTHEAGLPSQQKSQSVLLTPLVSAAPGLLRECGGNPERQQPDQHLHRWQDVLLESGHALSAAGHLNHRDELVNR